MMFLLLFTAVALGTVTVVCLPLLRGVPAAIDRGYFDRVVYRDQLKEVERDLARGVLSPTEADSARLEIQRRLLAVNVAVTGTVRSAPSPVLACVIALLVLVGGTGLYLHFGAPSLPDAPFTERSAERTEPPQAPDAAPHMDMRQAAEALEKKLHADPSNAEGWELYARTESMLGDYQKAEAGYRQAIGLGRKTPELFAAYGEMLVLQADGIVSPAAHDAFTQSLAIDPKNDVARYYLALGDEQAGEEQRAIDRWTALAADIPDDSPMRESIARGVAEAARQGGLTAPALPKGTPEPQQDATAGSQAGAGPNQDQMSAAAAMPEGERKQMIQTMVTQLAARLQTSPDDVDGWLRLGRSYAVLGEPDKAVDAFEHAVKLKPDDATIKLQEFDTLVAKLQPSDPLPPRALELLQQVAASDPDQPEALWYLGVQAARDGKPDVARADWTKLLGQLPADGEDAKMVKQALDALTK